MGIFLGDQAQFAEFVKKSNSKAAVTAAAAAAAGKRNRNVIVLPKSSRREVKVPLKYRDLEDDEQTSSTPSKPLLSKPQKQQQPSPKPPLQQPASEREPEQVIADKAQEIIGNLES